MKKVEITTERFRLRELVLEDVSERYLRWLHDPTVARFIRAAADTNDLSDLREYVRERLGRPDVLFLGIFDRGNGLHVGNIKYEPVDSKHAFAMMGILIGDPDYRGRGVAAEVLEASARWLKDERAVTQIVLGVTKDNTAAIRAYEAAGFKIESTPHLPGPYPDSFTMVLHL